MVNITDLKTIKIGEQDVKIYLGEEKVYPLEWKGKFKATYSGGETYDLACDDSNIITSADTHPNGYDYSAMTFFEIGDCATELGDYAFYALPETMRNAYSGKTLDLSNIKKFGSIVFTTVKHKQEITLYFGEILLRDVTSMSDGSLASCRCDFVIDNTTPPVWNLSQGVYPMPPYYIGYSIYVPDSAVETYKANKNWKNFKDNIKPMSEKPS